MSPRLAELRGGATVFFHGGFHTPIQQEIQSGAERIVPMATGVGVGPIFGYAEKALAEGEPRPMSLPSRRACPRICSACGHVGPDCQAMDRTGCDTHFVRIWPCEALRRAIRELAGHQDLTPTQRYMHLSPAALDSAIRLLDSRPASLSRGDSGNKTSSSWNLYARRRRLRYRCSRDSSR
jgi:hypothetical protein